MPPQGAQPAPLSGHGWAPQEGEARPPNPLHQAPGGRVYKMRREEVEDAPKVVTSNCSIKTHPIEVFFDSSATRSFISAKLVKGEDLKEYVMSLAMKLF